MDRPWFSYLTILLLQLKVVWGAWQYRDLTPGDTAGYFNRAYMWFDRFATDIAWSPLYTMFYGSLLFLSTDAYVVTILHRLLVVFGSTVLVLALMRRLLPSGLAWLVAAWWAVLPINFDALYEIHLFSVIPILVAWLLLTYPSPWMRGSAVAVMLTSCALVRNEFIAPTAVLAVLCVWWEIRATRRVSALPYLVPLLICGLLVGFVYRRSVFQFPRLHAVAALKHTENMCQVYAFGHQQRHPEWDKNPWTQCDGLMQSTFGSPKPSLTTMIRKNPRAVADHVLWNVRLVPNGIEILLFNRAAGAVNPDYAPAALSSPRALLLTGVCAVLLVVGGYRLSRERRFWWEYWLRERALPWLAILTSAVALAVVVVPTQRPRPSYLFSAGIALMGLVGMAVFVIARQVLARKEVAHGLALVMVGLPLLVPSYYTRPSYPKRRPLLEIYERLRPFAEMLGDPSTVLLASRYGDEVILYGGHNVSTKPMRSFNYGALGDQALAIPLEGVLARRGINLFYVDDALWTEEELPRSYQGFLKRSEHTGWKLIASSTAPQERWLLLRKANAAWYEDPLALLAANRMSDIGPVADREVLQSEGTLPIDGLLIGRGWHDLEREPSGEPFRWVENDAEIVLTLPSGGRKQLAIVIEPGPGLGSRAFNVKVMNEEGGLVATAAVGARQTVAVTLPVRPYRTSVFRLHVDGGGLPIPHDLRVLNFRVFHFHWE